MTAKAPFARITDQQAFEITRQDPPPNPDGSCVICRKPRDPERSIAYAGITATLDPFCSNVCARVWYQNPIPDGEALEEVAARRTPRSASTEAGSTLPRVERDAASSNVYVPRPDTRPARVLALLANGPMRLSALKLALNETANGPLGFALHDLAKRGLVVRLARGVYARAAVSEREPEAGESDVTAVRAQSVSAAPTGEQPSRSETAADDLDAALLAAVLDEAA